MADDDVRILEEGDLFFFYRPKVGTEEVQSLDEVQRLYLVLAPRDREVYRRIVIGRKRVPGVAGHERNWAFVDRVAKRPEPIEEELERERYRTKTRGERVQPEARPAGEGVYAITTHGDHVHLAYELELPEEPGEPQQELGIEKSASYIVTVKNPETGSPPQAGLSREQKATFPDELMAMFRGRRFGELDPRMLDHEGAELVMVGAKEDVREELGIELETEHETPDSAEVFRRLKLDRKEHPLEPLFEGDWA